MSEHEKTCERCGTSFTARVHNKRFCGQVCFDAHRKAYGARNLESRRVTRQCRQCGQDYTRVHEKSGFCSKSCGSKWHIAQGTFDAWRTKKLPRKGTYVKCEECENLVYVAPRFNGVAIRKLCSAKCESRYRSKIAKGDRNPMFGRSLSSESLRRQKATLLANHGVTNAYFLSVHRQVSRAQREILSYLTGTFPELGFEGEKYFASGSHRCFIDIVSERARLAVEFNGDYWHCNPSAYSGSFFHPKKRKTAEQIWEDDRQRLQALEKSGYRTLVVWESEYSADKRRVLEWLSGSVCQ